LIDENNIIIAGHTRLKAGIQLGLTFVPTIQVTDMTENEKKGYRIADNKVSEYAEWDMNLLKVELEGLEDFTGFNIENLNNIKDRIDLSNKIFEQFQVLIDCKNEIELEEMYNKLTNEGIKCRVSTY
jgi:hypothetical protein